MPGTCSRPRQLSNQVSTTEPLDHKESEETEEELAVSVLRYLASQVVDDADAINIKREISDDGKLHLTALRRFFREFVEREDSVKLRLMRYFVR